MWSYVGARGAMYHSRQPQRKTACVDSTHPVAYSNLLSTASPAAGGGEEYYSRCPSISTPFLCHR